MMFLKLRKFHRLLGRVANASHTFTALKLNNYKYCARWLGKEDTMISAATLITDNNWDADKALVIIAKVKLPRARAMIVIEDMTVEKLVKITNQVSNMKAFL